MPIYPDLSQNSKLSKFLLTHFSMDFYTARRGYKPFRETERN